LSRVAPGSPANALTALVLTTNPGLETLAWQELRERVTAAGHQASVLERGDSGVRGRLQVSATLDPDTLVPIARGMRSVHHLIRPLHRFELPEREALEAVRTEIARLTIPSLDGETPFRISAQRYGQHPFTSQDVERAAGAAVVDAYGAPVDLEGFTIELELAVVDRLCTVGLRLTRPALTKRLPRVFNARAGLRPNIAYAALRMAGVDHGTQRLLDPFCGSGTILMEAGTLYPDLQLRGSDWRDRVLDGAARNLEAGGLTRRSELAIADARALAGIWPPASADVIVTNPPYGKRIGRQVSFVGFYMDFLRSAREILEPGGRLALLAGKRGALRVAVERVGGYRIQAVRVVEMSRLFPGLFVLERTAD